MFLREAGRCPEVPDIAAKVAAATAQIQQNPRDANAWVRRASAYLTPASANMKPPLQNLEAAILDLEQALRLDPNNFYARHNYGNAAYLLGYQDFAIYEFDRAIQIDPRSARTWMGRGWSWYEKCELDRASSDFDRAVSLDQSLTSSIAAPAEIDSRRTECARIDWQLAHPPPPPPPQQGSTNIMNKIWEQQEAVRRAGEAAARGDNESARIIREQAGIR